MIATVGFSVGKTVFILKGGPYPNYLPSAYVIVVVVATVVTVVTTGVVTIGVVTAMNDKLHHPGSLFT